VAFAAGGLGHHRRRRRCAQADPPQHSIEARASSGTAQHAGGAPVAASERGTDRRPPATPGAARQAHSSSGCRPMLPISASR
jgi:hypothetical protein